MHAPRPIRVAAALPLFLIGARKAAPCDAGSCPPLTQGQDSARTKASFGIDVSFRTMDYGRYVGRPGAASALVDFANGRLVGNHHRDSSVSREPIAASSGGSRLAPTLDPAIGVGTRF